jgi:hypothetical protein
MWNESKDKWETLTATLANATPRSYFITASSYSDTLGADGISFASNAYSITL